MHDDTVLAEKLQSVLPYLNEKQRRILLASEARSLGYGGISRVARATGVSRPTIHQGLRELEAKVSTGSAVRHADGGRKCIEELDPTIIQALEQLVDPDARGDPMSALRWTCKSTRQLAAILKKQGHPVSHRVVAELLRASGYSLQSNVKTLEGTQHPDRDAQFHYLNKRIKAFLEQGLPVISVDTLLVAENSDRHAENLIVRKKRLLRTQCGIRWLAAASGRHRLSVDSVGARASGLAN
jgi:transposase